MAARFPQTPAIDTVLRQAYAHHQAGHLAEAEKLYRRVLAVRPDFAEVHVNLGNALKSQGRLDEAILAYRQGLGFKPSYAKGHYHLGDALAAQGKLEEAVSSYRRALVFKPDYAEVYTNLGVILAVQGNFDAAAELYRRALAIQPGMAAAHNNLGNILMQEGKLDEAVASYSRAIAVKPDYAEAHNNLGLTLAALQRFEEAVTSYRQALNHKPDYAEAHNNLGNALKEQGKLADAEVSYRCAIDLKPDYADAHYHLGMILCERNRIAEGFVLYTRYAELARGRSDPAHPVQPGLPHKIKHDQEQTAYLTGVEARDITEIAEGLRLADGGRIAGPAVNPGNEIGEIEKQWRQNRPQVAVIDQFLTDEALDKLRRFCWGSTIWRKVYREGYLGAMPEHGLACPLLAQIAEELRVAYPAIFADHPLLRLWAFKYDSQLGGIRLHADFAAVNVNFWITPDEANLAPESGGLVIWDVAAPLDWDYARYNCAEEDIREFLTRMGAKSMTVPYRANRAVIFDSDLFHQTDRLAFQEGYLNRRINVTLLYGRRETTGRTSEQ